MRIKIIRIAIIGLFLLIVLDLFYVQVIRGSYFYFLSKNNRIRIVPLEGWRGSVLDRNGEILAGSRETYNVMVAPQDVDDYLELFSYLSKVLDIPPKIIKQRYIQKKYAPFAPVVVAEDIDRDKAIVLEENKYLFPSLIIQESFKRSYPMGTNSAHVLGYVGKITHERKEKFKEYGYSPQSIVGYSGVEEFYDSDLKGDAGGVQIEVNSRGQQVRLLSFKEPTKGKDITLTIDSRIQDIAMELISGFNGSIVVMDMDTGEILGMTNAPTYDPNVFVDASKQKQLTELFKNRAAPFLNRAIKGLFPPGSVFKVPISVGALDSKKITPATTFLCKGYYALGGRKFGCTHIHGPENLTQALAHSCNVYYYNLGMMLGADTIHQYLQKFGFGQLTHIDLPYEEKGIIPSRRRRSLQERKQWYAGDTLNISIGQGGTLTTPLQLVRMMATVANNGMEVRPHVIKAIEGMPVKQYGLKKRIDIDESVFASVQRGIREAVTDPAGTARALYMDQVYVAGKTGTAQSSGESENHAWFVGYVQKAKKNISFCVFLEHGGSSQNAVVIAKELLLKMKEQEIL